MQAPGKGWTRFVAFGDTHIPYEDVPALLEVLEVIKWYKPDLIVHIGDLLDGYAVSSHPAKKQGLLIQQEIDMGKAFLSHLRSIQPEAWIHLVQGNHTERLERLLINKAPALRSLQCLGWPKLLELDRWKIGFTPYPDVWEPWGEKGLFQFKHGTSARNSHPGATRWHYMRNAGFASGCSGHTHRGGVSIRKANGFTQVWAETGHLCGPQASEDYIPGNRPDWTTGFVLGTRSPDGEVAMMFARIIDDRAQVPGWF